MFLEARSDDSQRFAEKFQMCSNVDMTRTWNLTVASLSINMARHRVPEVLASYLTICSLRSFVSEFITKLVSLTYPTSDLQFITGVMYALITELDSSAEDLVINLAS